MVHDWFSHGKGASPDQVEPFRMPIDEDDPFLQKPLIGPRTTPDPTRGPADEGRPPTFVNVETHWWDASQIYGSSDALVARKQSLRLDRLVCPAHVVRARAQSDLC